MKRYASEVLRNLETRIAKLEKRAGFSSWKCQACGKSIISHLKWDERNRDRWSDKSKWMSEMVVIFPNGKVEIDEAYDGYHNINGRQLPIGDDSAPFSVFHKKCWEKSGKPGYVGEANYAEDQGWFLRGEPRSKPKAMGEDQARRRENYRKQTEVEKEIESGAISQGDALSRAAYQALESKTGVSNYTEIDTMYLEGVGSRGGQFHFFVLWEDTDTGLFVGASAYGKLANPAGVKAVEIARNEDLSKVERKVATKYRSKVKKYPIEKKRFARLDGGFVPARCPLNRPVRKVAAKIEWDVLYNIIEAMIDQIADITRNPSLSRPTPEKARFVSWFMTEGREGEIPEGISSSIINDSLKTVLLNPPSWMKHLLPKDASERLQLARQIKTPI